MHVSGVKGRLLHAYQQAAALGAWSFDAPEHAAQHALVRARVISSDAYWFEQRPLDLVLNLGDVEWRWRDVSVSDDKEGVAIRVSGRPESFRFV